MESGVTTERDRNFLRIMSLDKAIEHNKEHRKKFRGSKSFDPHCRNHGACSWCVENRTFFDKKERERTERELKDYENNCSCSEE